MASGDTLVIFTALNSEPPDTNHATLDTRSGAANAQHLVLDFNDTTDESAEFGFVMPRNYAGTTGITVTLGWMATSATSGGVSWDVSFKSVSDDLDDIDTKAFASANNSGSETTASASGEVKYTTITFTDGADMDSIAVGEYARIRVTRDADGTTATDDMVGDAELLFVEIQET